MFIGHSCSYPDTADREECHKRRYGLLGNKRCHFCHDINKVKRYDKRSLPSGILNRCVAHGRDDRFEDVYSSQEDNCVFEYDDCSDPPTVNEEECAKRKSKSWYGKCYYCSGPENFDWTKTYGGRTGPRNKCVGNEDRCEYLM